MDQREVNMAAKKGHIGESKDINVRITKSARSSTLFECVLGERWHTRITVSEYYNHVEKQQDVTRNWPGSGNKFLGGSYNYIFKDDSVSWDGE